RGRKTDVSRRLALSSPRVVREPYYVTQLCLENRSATVAISPHRNFCLIATTDGETDTVRVSSNAGWAGIRSGTYMPPYVQRAELISNAWVTMPPTGEGPNANSTQNLIFDHHVDMVSIRFRRMLTAYPRDEHLRSYSPLVMNALIEEAIIHGLRFSDDYVQGQYYHDMTSEPGLRVLRGHFRAFDDVNPGKMRVKFRSSNRHEVKIESEEFQGVVTPDDARVRRIVRSYMTPGRSEGTFHQDWQPRFARFLYILLCASVHKATKYRDCPPNLSDYMQRYDGVVTALLYLVSCDVLPNIMRPSLLARQVENIGMRPSIDKKPPRCREIPSMRDVDGDHLHPTGTQEPATLDFVVSDIRTMRLLNPAPDWETANPDWFRRVHIPPLQNETIKWPCCVNPGTSLYGFAVEDVEISHVDTPDADDRSEYIPVI
ncbi:MAG: hypothetical protein AAFQ17_04495, partial [Pseudomonadota bacterium]